MLFKSFLRTKFPFHFHFLSLTNCTMSYVTSKSKKNTRRRKSLRVRSKANVWKLGFYRNIYKMYKKIVFYFEGSFVQYVQRRFSSTRVSTRSLRSAGPQRPTRGGCSERSRAPVQRWGPGTSPVRPATAPLESHCTASRRPVAGAAPKRFCRASAWPRGALSAQHSIRSDPVEERRCWSGSRTPPGGWGGASSPPCSHPRKWTGSAWPRRRTRWTRLGIYPELMGLWSQQLWGGGGGREWNDEHFCTYSIYCFILF